MKSILLGLLIAVLIAAAAYRNTLVAPGRFEVITIEPVESYFSVGAPTTLEVMDQFRERGPTGYYPDRGGAVAGTNVSIETDWQLLPTPGGCKALGIQVYTKAFYILPKWDNNVPQSVEMHAEWDRFYTHMLAHEHDHGKLGEEYATIMLDRLMAVETNQSCRDVDEDMEDVELSVRSDHHMAQLDLDKREGHFGFPLSPGQ